MFDGQKLDTLMHLLSLPHLDNKIYISSGNTPISLYWLDVLYDHIPQATCAPYPPLIESTSTYSFESVDYTIPGVVAS